LMCNRVCRLLLTRCNGALHVYDHGTATWPRALPKLTDRGAHCRLVDQLLRQL